MADGRITIEVEVDGKQVSRIISELDSLANSGAATSKVIKAVVSSVAEVDESSSSASKSVKGVKDSLEGAGEAGNDTSKAIKGATESLSGLSDAGVDTGKSVENTTDGLASLGDGSVDTSKNVEAVTESLGQLSEESSTSGKSLKVAADEIDGVGDSSSEGAKKINETTESVEQLSKSARKTFMERLKEELKGVGENSSNSSMSIKDMATSLGLVKVASAAIGILNAALDGAISRYDTLNQYPKVLGALGVETDVATASTNRLAEGIDGLPTTLNEVAANAQQLFLAFGDAETATETTIALNNALLGSGSNAGQAQRGFDMYNKALQRGEMNAVTWTTLNETMGIGLSEIAEKFGFAGDSARMDLFKALQDGNITMSQFNDKLIEVGTGTGKMAGLAQEMSVGIATSFTNMKNSSVRGLANIIKAVDELAVAVSGKNIAQNLDTFKGLIDIAFKAAVKSIQAMEKPVKVTMSAIKALTPVVKALTPAIVGMVAAFATATVIQKVTAMVNSSKVAYAAYSVAIKLHTAVTNLYTASVKRHAAAEMLYRETSVASNVVMKISSMLLVAKTAILKVYTTAIGLSTGAISLSTVVTNLATIATTAFGVAIKVLLGPIGWAVLAVGALVGAAVGLVKHFNKASKETEELKKETDELVESTDALTESSRNNASERKKSIKSAVSQRDASKKLAEQLQDLANKENKTTGEKARMKSMVDQLNSSVEGLNLAYDDEADKLNVSNDLLVKRVEAFGAQEKLESGQQRLNDILKEQNEIESQLESNAEAREKWNDRLADGEVSAMAAKAGIKELNEADLELTTTLTGLKSEQDQTTTSIETATTAITEATENGIYNMIIAYDDWSDTQKSTTESLISGYDSAKESATGMFDTIEEKAAISFDQMKANMEKNAEVSQRHATALATIAEKGGEGMSEGYLAKLRELPLESVGQLEELAARSDAELQELSSMYERNGEQAKADFLKGQGISEEDLGPVTAMMDMVETTLKTKVEAANFNEIGKTIKQDMLEDVGEVTGEDEEKLATLPKNMLTSLTGAVEATDFKAPFGNISNDITGELEAGSKKVEEASSKVADGASNGFSNKIKETDFKSLGGFIPQGVTGGIEEGTEAAAGASGKLAEDISKRFASEAQINSPSRVFEQHGKFLVDGLVQGIDGGGSNAVASMANLAKQVAAAFELDLSTLPQTAQKTLDGMNKTFTSGGTTVVATANKTSKDIVKQFEKLPENLDKIAKAAIAKFQAGIQSGYSPTVSSAARIHSGIVSAFSSLPDQLTSVGRNAISGLNNGLLAGQSTVLTTANNIANQIATTMKKALDIHSPSRVMRDDIGRFIPLGIAEGIDKDAGAVYKAMDSLNRQFVMPAISAESVLDVRPSMSFNPSGSFSSNQSSGKSNSETGIGGDVHLSFVVDTETVGQKVFPIIEMLQNQSVTLEWGKEGI